ncbi:hypothetical protein [Nocardia gipuzkoensis]|uniref:hypothetical protein n=1 Tax=Nocardia gipuzkoensis TaxID=2749991 RepID=UPI003EE21538
MSAQEYESADLAAMAAQAEQERLAVVDGVLTDMFYAASAAACSRDDADRRTARAKVDHVNLVRESLHAEQVDAWIQMLDPRPEQARTCRDQPKSRGIERSR